MDSYDFEVLRGDEIVGTKRSIGFHDSRAAWPWIADLARGVDEPGCRIRVTDQYGRIVILVGVATARRYFASARAA